MRGKDRINEMYAFVVVDDDDTEGIPAFLDASGTAMPMVGADSARVESLIPIAEAMAASINKPIEVVRFTVRESIRTIRP